MSRLLCCALLVVVSTATLTSLSFDDYLTRFGKRYTHAEYRVRKSIYEERVAAIVAHNQAGKSYTRTINQFTDQTETELASMMGMNKHRHYTRGLARSLAPLTPRRVTAAAPSEIDWSKNATTAVKNQVLPPPKPLDATLTACFSPGWLRQLLGLRWHGSN
jgi:hypothetical protein